MSPSAKPAAESALRHERSDWPVVILPLGVFVIWQGWFPGAMRWEVMWAMAGALFAACKWISWRTAPKAGVSPVRQAAYFFLWPGLDAEAFMDTSAKFHVEPPTEAEWQQAGRNLAAGVALIWIGPRLVYEHWPLAGGWLGMIAFILMAHCGVFQLLSCAWRKAGVNARPLMLQPLFAQSLSEFWGRRWNTAFRDFTGKFLFFPLTHRLGPRWALLAGFVFSGAVHELVITLPAGGGYGGPTLYFTLQGAAILLEKSATGRKLGLGRGERGQTFAWFTLIAPAALAFPPVFVYNVILPMMSAAHAL